MKSLCSTYIYYRTIVETSQYASSYFFLLISYLFQKFFTEFRIYIVKFQYFREQSETENTLIQEINAPCSKR